MATKPEKKIFLEKTHDLEFIVGKIIEAEAERVILNIPRDAAIGKALHNFQVLKREAETAGKEIFIESVDDHILELASIVGIESRNPVFRNSERAVSDILPRGSFKNRIVEIKDSVDREVLEPSRKFSKNKKGKLLNISKNSDEKNEIPATPFYEEPSPRRSKFFPGFRRLLWITLALGLIFGTGGFAMAKMPRADIRIILKKTPVDFEDTIEISNKVSRYGLAGDRITVPGELLISEKNMTKSFKSNAKKRVEAKAEGAIIVYNAYSSEKQSLVAQTRFESPDKKIFRITKAVTIPGAKIENGKIVPSKIEVLVVAEEYGDTYNLAPMSPWKIPGFKGSPKYEGFYGESLKPMAGGFIGEVAAPTSEDLEGARKDLVASLTDALRGEMAVLASPLFKIFDDAEFFKVLEEKIDTSLGEGADSFNLFMRGELRRIVFEENTLKEAIAARARRGLPEGLRYRDFEINYSNRSFDFLSGKMTFEAEGSVSFESDVKISEIRREILGKDKKSLQSLVFALPGLEKATVSLWPFWVGRVPENEKKVKIEVD